MPLATLEKWDVRFLDLAKHISQWSKDPSTKVGAVIVRPDRTVCSIGYNGFARGVNDDEERYMNRDVKYELVIHAEANAILKAKEDLDGYTIYVTPFRPCNNCAGLVIQSGITTVVCPVHPRKADYFSHTHTQFQEAGVELKEVGYDYH